MQQLFILRYSLHVRYEYNGTSFHIESRSFFCTVNLEVFVSKTHLLLVFTWIMNECIWIRDNDNSKVWSHILSKYKYPWEGFIIVKGSIVCTKNWDYSMQLCNILFFWKWNQKCLFTRNHGNKNVILAAKSQLIILCNIFVWLEDKFCKILVFHRQN